jgi:hypothetical protein
MAAPASAALATSTAARASVAHDRTTIRPPSGPDSMTRLKSVAREAEESSIATTAERDPRCADLETRLVGAIRGHDVDSTLFLASVLVYVEPDNAIARRIKERCVVLMKRHDTAVFPEADAVPRRVVAWSSLEGKGLSSKALYILSLIDGVATVETIIDCSAIPVLVAYDALEWLVNEGTVALEPHPVGQPLRFSSLPPRARNTGQGDEGPGFANR